MRCASPPESVSARAVERQIVEADVVEELQPVDDFLDDLVGDRLSLALELEAAEEIPGLA